MPSASPTVPLLVSNPSATADPSLVGSVASSSGFLTELKFQSVAVSRIEFREGVHFIMRREKILGAARLIILDAVALVSIPPVASGGNLYRGPRMAP